MKIIANVSEILAVIWGTVTDNGTYASELLPAAFGHY